MVTAILFTVVYAMVGLGAYSRRRHDGEPDKTAKWLIFLWPFMLGFHIGGE